MLSGYCPLLRRADGMLLVLASQCGRRSKHAASQQVETMSPTPRRGNGRCHPVTMIVMVMTLEAMMMTTLTLICRHHELNHYVQSIKRSVLTNPTSNYEPPPCGLYYSIVYCLLLHYCCCWATLCQSLVKPGSHSLSALERHQRPMLRHAMAVRTHSLQQVLVLLFP